MIIAHGADFETTHDIDALLDRARDAGESIPADVEEAAALSRYAGSGRYEFDTDAEGVEVTEEDLQRALKRGRAAVKWAEDGIRRILGAGKDSRTGVTGTGKQKRSHRVDLEAEGQDIRAPPHMRG